MMKTASLPPGMAARDRNTRSNESRLDAILNTLEGSRKTKKRNNKNNNLENDDEHDSTCTDEDRMSENSFAYNKSGSGVADGKASKHKAIQFQPYNSSRLFQKTLADGVFESTSNDNHASRLRVQAAK